MGDLIHRIGDGYIGIATQDWPLDHEVAERMAELAARVMAAPDPVFINHQSSKTKKTRVKSLTGNLPKFSNRKLAGPVT